jgi:hypothetical protein
MEYYLGDALDDGRWIVELQLAEVYDWPIIKRYEMLSTISKFCFEGEELWNMVLSTGATDGPVAMDLWGLISLPGVRRRNW